MPQHTCCLVSTALYSNFWPLIDHCALLFAFSLKQKSREERKWKMEGNRHISLGDFRVEISYVVKQSIQGAKDQKVQGHQIFIKFVCTGVKFKRQDCLSSFRYTNVWAYTGIKKCTFHSTNYRTADLSKSLNCDVICYKKLHQYLSNCVLPCYGRNLDGLGSTGCIFYWSRKPRYAFSQFMLDLIYFHV